MDVPSHRKDVYRAKSSAYCVCVFVLNEGERIRRQLAKMRTLTDAADIIVVDGGSTDSALDPGYLRDCGVSALLVKTEAGGLSSQMRIGFKHALEQGYEGVIVIDGNDKDDPVAIPLFTEALRGGFDHVQGSRFIAGGAHKNTPLSRLLALRLIHAPLISLASGHRYTDTTNGFRGYSRKFLEDPRVQPFREVFKKYELHYYLAIRAARLGFRITEVPVTRAYPGKGKVPSKISGIKGNLSLIATLIKACFHRFNP